MNKYVMILSIYDGTDDFLLENSIKSIIDQSFKDFDIFIVIDGFISDNKYTLLSNLESTFTVTVFKNDKNFGLAYSLNYLFNTCKKKYSLLIRHDLDDISYANRVDMLVKFFLNNREVDFFGSYSYYFLNNAKVNIKTPTTLKEVKYKNRYMDAFIHGSVAFNMDRLSELELLYDSECVGFEDTELWCRLITNGYLGVNLPEFLYGLYFDDSFFSRRTSRKVLWNTFMVREKYYGGLGLGNILNILHFVLKRYNILNLNFLYKLRAKFL